MTKHVGTWTKIAALLIAMAWLPAIVATQAAQAQTFTVLHAFDGADGWGPTAVLLDSGGNLWGTAYSGGAYEDGTVWELSHGSWNFFLRYVFGTGQNDGFSPNGQMVQAPNGVLYGTTTRGGTCGGGTVFQLTPPATAARTAAHSHWTMTVIHDFCLDGGGAAPYGALTVDATGNLYGTTSEGGGGDCSGYGCGTVFKLTRSNNAWTYSVLYTFTGGADGASPLSGVVLDAAGNLYGTTEYGGESTLGVVYKLTPSGSESVLYTFTTSNQGGLPVAGVVLDRSGNLYGTTVNFCSEFTESPFTCGADVFELSPSGGGSWNYTVIHQFTGYFSQGYDLIMDDNGNLYGTVRNEGPDYDEVYKLTPSDGGWIYSVLHDFNGGDDGYSPDVMVRDASGNILGVCFNGGAAHYGAVWEITP